MKKEKTIRTIKIIFCIIALIFIGIYFYKTGGFNIDDNTVDDNYIEYHFRNEELLNSHYEKHGIEMGFESAQEYEKAACDVINNPVSLHKKEKEDNDDVFFIEETSEFVVLSYDGFIRTYFIPSSGKKYFDKQ